MKTTNLPVSTPTLVPPDSWAGRAHSSFQKLVVHLSSLQENLLLLINPLSILPSAFESTRSFLSTCQPTQVSFLPHPKEEETGQQLNWLLFTTFPFHLQSPKSSLSLWIFPPLLQSCCCPPHPPYSNESSPVISMLLRPGDTFLP